MQQVGRWVSWKPPTKVQHADQHAEGLHCAAGLQTRQGLLKRRGGGRSCGQSAGHAPANIFFRGVEGTGRLRRQELSRGKEGTAGVEATRNASVWSGMAKRRSDAAHDAAEEAAQDDLALFVRARLT